MHDIGWGFALGNVLAAAGFIAVMSLVREPSRFQLNAVIGGGLAATYLGGKLGVYEVIYMALAIGVAFLAVKRSSYPLIGVCWLLHTGWDTVHHAIGSPIWPFMPLSSAGCAMFDAFVALWFFAGAPSIFVRMGVVRRRLV